MFFMHHPMILSSSETPALVPRAVLRRNFQFLRSFRAPELPLLPPSVFPDSTIETRSSSKVHELVNIHKFSSQRFTYIMTQITNIRLIFFFTNFRDNIQNKIIAIAYFMNTADYVFFGRRLISPEP